MTKQEEKNNIKLKLTKLKMFMFITVLQNFILKL